MVGPHPDGPQPSPGRGPGLTRKAGAFVLGNARILGSDVTRDVALLDGRVVGGEKAQGPRLDLASRWLLPGLVNALDQLDLSVFPPLGSPPFASLYDWAASVESIAGPAERAAVGVPLADRLFLGGLRNLLAGATAVVHHHPTHRSLERDDFPVRVLERYQFADSPGRTPALRRTYRSTGRMMEKYDVVDLNRPAGGGEYPTQDGFGWTNGVALALSAQERGRAVPTPR